jgi:hypothetical protein
MAGLPTPNFDTATIAGVDCHTPAWTLTNTHVLRNPAPKRRDNVELYGVDGVLARESTYGPRTVNLEFYVIGTYNYLGVAQANGAVAVERSITYLRTNLYEATEGSDNAVWAEVIAADGIVYGGQIQLDDFEAQPGIGDRFVFMQATLVDGWLEPLAGS